jgi:hypothetical protein
MRTGTSDSRKECEECKNQRFLVEFGGKLLCRDCVHKALNNKVVDFIEEKRYSDDGVARTYPVFTQLYGSEAAEKWSRAPKDPRSIQDVVNTIETSREIVGKTAAATSVSTIKTVLSTRLREAATDAIHEGKTRVREDHIKRFSQALADAHNCKYLEKEVDLAEFDHLLQNLEVRLKSSIGDDESVGWLVQELQAAAQPGAGGTPSLTDMTLTVICARLLQAAQQKPGACVTIAKLGAVAAIRKILLGELSTRTNLKAATATAQKGSSAQAAQATTTTQASPQHPELQVFMAMLLAEIALHATADANRQQGGSNASAVSGGELRADTPAGLRETIGAGNVQTVTSTGGGSQTVSRRMAAGLPGDSQLSLDILTAGLRSGVKRGEHSLVWAVMCGLRHAATHPRNKQHLVSQGAVPVVKRAIEFYEAADPSLPKPEPRPTAKALTLQGDAPAFLSKAKSQALLRYTGSVKQSWISSHTVLPSLAFATSYGRFNVRKDTVDWYAGSPTAIASRVDQRGTVIQRRATIQQRQNAADYLVGLSPAQRQSLSMGKTMSLSSVDEFPLSATTSITSKLQQEKGTTSNPINKTMADSGGSGHFPSLMWLISEDRVNEQAFYRCCDKGMVVLQARWLLRDLESSAREEPNQVKTNEVHRNPVWDYTQKVGT